MQRLLEFGYSLEPCDPREKGSRSSNSFGEIYHLLVHDRGELAKQRKERTTSLHAKRPARQEARATWGYNREIFFILGITGDCTRGGLPRVA